MSDHDLVLYESPDGSVSLDLKLQGETLWMTQRQISLLFDRDTDTIGLHLKNIYAEGELDEAATTEDSSVVQTEGKRQVKRQVTLYNLDAVLSVGYRVNSKRGTQFRQWANRVLKDHLVQGYSVNVRRLSDLNAAVRLVTNLTSTKTLSGDEAKALLAMLGDFQTALTLLDDYDHQRMDRPQGKRGIVEKLDLDEARRMVARMGLWSGASDLFGQEKDDSLAGTLRAIYQTYEGADLYPSLEEKAANLLYFLVKNHCFVDGNKRIGAALFLWFLEKNGRLYLDGRKVLDDGTVVALTLLMAESRPEDREILVTVTLNLLKASEARP